MTISSKQVDPKRPVADFVVENPGAARVFERFQIDYCCGGRRSLAEACSRASAPVFEVARELENCVARAHSSANTNHADGSLTDLARHIVERHHVYLRRELPRLSGLLSKVVAAHANAHGELHEIARVFAALETELLSHMLKEERVLFPIVASLEKAAASGSPRPTFHCGGVENPISVMEDEHRSAGDALARLRWLTSDFQPPDDACPTYVALLAGLAELESDLHEHIHLENNILFPRAAALESRLS